MASKFAKPLAIPPDFPDVLRNFAREVLRQQGKIETQEAIFEFGAQYFRDLIDKRSGSGAKASGAAETNAPLPLYCQLTEDEVRELVVGAFAASSAAASGDGVISFDELRLIVSQIGEELQFSQTELKAIFADADENDDGFVAYDGFVPLAVQAALILRETREQRMARRDSRKKAGIDAGTVFLHGLMQDEMENLLREIFHRVDQEEAGVVPRLAFMDSIRDADLGFTRREVNILMSEAPVATDDEGGAGAVLYPDFIPICFQVLQDVFAAGIVELPSDQDGLTQYLTEVFASGDADATGLLSVADLTRLLRGADIGLTRLQIIIAMAEAQEDKSGFVHYEKFAAHAAGMLLALLNIESQAVATYLFKYRQSSEYYTVLDLNEHAFEQALTRALEAADEDRRGVLGKEEVVEALTNALPEITQRQVRALLALAEPNEMGELEYALVAHSAFQTLQKLQEYDRMIMES